LRASRPQPTFSDCEVLTVAPILETFFSNYAWIELVVKSSLALEFGERLADAPGDPF
jgi:hypothetical protein